MNNISDRVKYFINLVSGVVILAFNIFLLVAILSYNELDNSLNAVNTNAIIFNKMGKAGAFIADFFVQLFGIVSFFIIFLLSIVAFNLIRTPINDDETNEKNAFFYNPHLKIIMFILFVLSSCGFVSKISSLFGDKIKISGGAIGFYITSMTSYVNKFLLFFVYLINICLSLNVITEFDRRKTYKIIGVILTFSIKILKLPFILMGKILKKIFSFIVPESLIDFIKYRKIERKNKKKDENDEIKQIIESQNKKIEFLQQYIKNAQNKSNPDDEYEISLEKKLEMEKSIAQQKINEIDRGDDKVLSSSGYGKYKLPQPTLLNSSNGKIHSQTENDLKEQAIDLLRVLEEYKIKGKILKIKAGPIITLHEFQLAAGIKSSRVVSLADDIARNLEVKSTRISTIPEKNALGIELPNRVRNTIYLRDILESDEYKNTNMNLQIVLGVNIAGESSVVDLTKCPHLLMAGTTGSGKSVAINAVILSLLFKYTPEECRFIMIDPKILELSVYEGIPHLLSPVVTEPKRAVLTLKWVVNEMENRYSIMESLGVRNIAGYNEKVKDALARGRQLEAESLIGYDKNGDPIYERKTMETKIMPYIVIVVDEMADLILTAGKDIEILIQRLAQKARAAGIHVIMATQRPSTDVITGVIKANFPSRVSFLVSSRIDSRVVIGEQGAEQLLGYGDMLFSINGGKIVRAHAPFVSDDEVEKVVQYIKKQGIKPNYINAIFEDEDGSRDEDSDINNIDISIGGKKSSSNDEIYKEAINIIKRDKRISISYIQRQLNIGYNKAANIIERMEKEGIIATSVDGKKKELVEE